MKEPNLIEAWKINCKIRKKSGKKPFTFKDWKQFQELPEWKQPKQFIKYLKEKYGGGLK